MPRYLIRDSAQSDEAWTDERCFIREILNDPGVPDVSLAEARVEPGVTTRWHRVLVAEWYVIRDGEGQMEVADAGPFAVVAGDTVAIPAGERQRITNTGNRDLRFDCICSPRFRPEAYESLEPDC